MYNFHISRLLYNFMMSARVTIFPSVAARSIIIELGIKCMLFKTHYISSQHVSYFRFWFNTISFGFFLSWIVCLFWFRLSGWILSKNKTKKTKTNFDENSKFIWKLLHNYKYDSFDLVLSCRNMENCIKCIHLSRALFRRNASEHMAGGMNIFERSNRTYCAQFSEMDPN